MGPRPPHLPFPVHEPTQVGEVRRAAVQLASQQGFDEVATGRVALVATELGTNLVRHARQGQLWVGLAPGPEGVSLEILSVDEGPGITDLRACMADGYSTGGTPGTGLGAVQRLSDEFDVYSTMPGGTVIMARVRHAATAARGPASGAAGAIVVGGVAMAAPGETVCGDAWHAQIEGGRAALYMADGLGHGPEAAEAAWTGAEAFARDPHRRPSQAIERLHELLRPTRGAAVLVAQLEASLDAQASGIVFCGAGNIAGRVVSGVEDRSLVPQHGTVGVQIRRPVDTLQAWPEHALLVLHTDGLVSRWALDAPGLLQRHPAVVAAWLMRDHRRGRDDATVVVAKRSAIR